MNEDPAVAIQDYRFIEFVEACEQAVQTISDQVALRDQVAVYAGELAKVWQMPDAAFRQLQPGAPYSSYQLYLNEQESLSVIMDIFAPGQIAPIHNHCCWGVFVCLEGRELERQYQVPEDLSAPPVQTRVFENEPGQVSVADAARHAFHQVECLGEVPAISLHIYGANLKTLERDRWDQDSGDYVGFVSGSDPARRQDHHYLTPAGFSVALAAPTSLPRLSAQVRRDLGLLKLPPAQWTATKPAPDGSPCLDVLIIGAGMYGLASAGSLLLKGVSNIQLLDQASENDEGPWVTYARMPTLRSPKDLPGACFGIASLTFRAWYEASYGVLAWQVLGKIPNASWQDYLGWLREMLALPVENNCSVVDLQVSANHVAATTAKGKTYFAKHVVIATGRASAGGFRLPDSVEPALWPDLAAHTSESIDFSALKGKSIAVMGAGASAWDNAATALEAGAASVDMFCRRKVLPQLNKGKANANPGFFDGWSALAPADKWAMAVYLQRMQPAPPHESVLRTLTHEGFQIHFESPIKSVKRTADRAVLELASGEHATFDFLILATGFQVDLAKERMFDRMADRILLWQDCYEAPPELVFPELGKMPFLGRGFELQERDGRAESELNRLHMFNSAAYLSYGALTLDVPSLTSAGARLATHLCERLFCEDFDDIAARLKAWEQEHELQPTSLYEPDYINRIA